MPKSRGFLAWIGQQRGQFWPGAAKQLIPFQPPLFRLTREAPSPTSEVTLSNFEEGSVLLDSGGNERVKGETSDIVQTMIRVDRGSCRLRSSGYPTGDGPETGSLAACAHAAHTLGGGNRPAGRWTAQTRRGTALRSHFIIVTCYEKQGKPAITDGCSLAVGAMVPGWQAADCRKIRNYFRWPLGNPGRLGALFAVVPALEQSKE